MSFMREPNAEPIPGYRLIEPLGSGGFGEVWKCEAPGGLFKAIKFLYGNLNSLDMEGVRAEQEFNALQRVKEVRHPFVLTIDRFEVVEGQLVIVMELADKSLFDLFTECQAVGLIGIPRDNLLRYIRDAAEALDHMIGKHNLQHLDIKPRNLFLISDRVKVADFGLVKHLEKQSGMLNSVTPLYAPPETFQGQISEHSDQYSLAIVYQELLTGQRPFLGKNARQLAMQHTQEPPELRSLPEAERPVVARALSKDPSQRFPNCLAFVRALHMAWAPKAEPPTLDEKPAEQRPRTMSETMEDIFLEQGSEDALADLPAVVAADPGSAISKLGMTMHQPQTGALRPTLVIGIGSFGRRALLELRCRFFDRFGDLGKIPLVRFLYIDSDPEAVKNALRGSPELSIAPAEVYHLPLQQVTNYRRRMLEQLNEWLPREKLYTLPRSLQTQGSRALGRLAFCDNYLRLLTRLRRDVQQVCHPDALYQSVSQTGLALRDNKPRVYLIAAAGGGGSGLLVDLGYTLRRMLQQLRYAEAEVTALLLCGAPDDPATPKLEQANTYAAVTEINHFSDSNIPFSVQYGADGPRTVDQGQPFTSVYLLKLAHRSPEALGDAVAHLGSYLFHELTTPLGLRLDRDRRLGEGTGGTVFRSFGTHGVWFPRGLLLRMASRQACVQLVEEWQASGEPTALAEVEAGCARALTDTELRFESICGAIEREVSNSFEGNLAAALTGILSALEEQSQQSVAQNDPGNWSRQALNRMQEWVGVSSDAEHDSGWRRTRLGRALATAIQKVAEDWDKRLAAAAFGLMEHAGRRVAAAEAAMRRFSQFCLESAETHSRVLERQLERTHRAWQQLEQAMENCLTTGGGFNFFVFGSRARRQLRVFMDHLAAFSRQRLAEEVTAAGLHFLAALRSRLDERIRDLAFCRQRLRHLQESLVLPPDITGDGVGARLALDAYPMQAGLSSTEAYWEAIRQSATARLVLPEGEEDLEQAAGRFLGRLNMEQWIQLDQAVQDRLLAGLGGLHQVCVSGSDLARTLANTLVATVAERLGEDLPITDVAEVEFSSEAAGKTDLTTQIRSYFASAAPLVAGQEADNRHDFLLVPASDAGKTFGEEARRALPGLELVRVPGQADLMFCREQGYLSAEDVQKLLRSCRRAYVEATTTPTTSPHARFDIVDWVPLDP